MTDPRRPHRFVELDGSDTCADCSQSPGAPIHTAITVTPQADDAPMTALWFAEYARQLGAAARDLGLVAPAFRSPPRDGSDRSIYWVGETAVVSVRLRDRPAQHAKLDMCVGTIVANRIETDSPKALMLAERMGEL
jgi:hypothetical protein